MAGLKSTFQGWKALPERSFGGGRGKPAPKEIKTWADVPHCKNHPDAILYPNEWKKKPGTFFWNCPEDTDRTCRNGTATREEFDQYSKLDQDEKPTGKPSVEIFPWHTRGKLIQRLKDAPTYEEYEPSERIPTILADLGREQSLGRIKSDWPDERIFNYLTGA